jgi:hypothetical protein
MISAYQEEGTKQKAQSKRHKAKGTKQKAQSSQSKNEIYHRNDLRFTIY